MEAMAYGVLNVVYHIRCVGPHYPTIPIKLGPGTENPLHLQCRPGRQIHRFIIPYGRSRFIHGKISSKEIQGREETMVRPNTFLLIVIKSWTPKHDPFGSTPNAEFGGCTFTVNMEPTSGSSCPDHSPVHVGCWVGYVLAERSILSFDPGLELGRVYGASDSTKAHWEVERI
jgi:hypothetical protein